MSQSSATFERITAAQEKILIALGRFKYLTVSQMITLEIMTDRSNINKNLALLRSCFKPLAGSISFGVHPQKGKLESVHYLTPRGALLLQERYGARYPLRFPKGSSGLFQQEYFHRIHTVDCHIALSKWAAANDIDILYFQTYFDKLSSGKKNGYRAESAILIGQNDYLIADALCLLGGPRREELYALEMFNGGNTDRVHGSLFAHLQALNHGQPSKQFGLQYGSRVLCVFENENYKRLAMDRINADPRFKKAKTHFLFKSISQMGVDQFFDWQLFDGSDTCLF